MPYGKKDLVPPRSLYKYRPFADPHGSIRKMMISNCWWFGSRRSFDDDEDLIFPGVEDDRRLAGLDLERVKGEMQNVINETGVFCLSESPKDPDLWKRYAADGAGICVELESDYVADPEFGPFKVVYSDRPKPLWDHFVGPEKRRKLLDAHLLQKGRFWRKQAEWRCIRKWQPREQSTANRYYPIAPRALLAVIFGWRLTEQEKLQVAQWIQAGVWRRTVVLKQARLEDGHIRIQEISPHE
jgi:hypothetical protein